MLKNNKEMHLKKINDRQGESLAVIFKILSNLNRLRLFNIILNKRLLNLDELVGVANIKRPAIEYHLKIMTVNKIIKQARLKNTFYYSINLANHNMPVIIKILKNYQN